MDLGFVADERIGCILDNCQIAWPLWMLEVEDGKHVLVGTP